MDNAFAIEVANDIQTLPGLASALGVSVGHMRKAATTPGFPKPMRSIAGAKVWSASQVADWMQVRDASDGAPAIVTLREITQRLLPAEWADDDVHLGCYRIENAAAFGPPGAAALRAAADHAHFVAYHGEIEYYEPGRTIVTTHGGGRVEMTGHSAPYRVGPGLFLLLATRTSDEDGSTLRALRGATCAVAGRNCAFEEVFRAHLRREDGKVILTAEASQNPRTFPPIEDVPQAIVKTALAIEATRAATSPDKIRASLSWFEQSLHGRGTDGFVKCWIAIETLAMTDASVDPLVERLSRIYDLKDIAVRDQLGPRTMQKLRNRIVHSGDIENVHHQVTDHLAAMYVDCLLDALALPPQRHMLANGSPRAVVTHARALVKGTTPEPFPEPEGTRRWVRFAMELGFADS